MTKGRLDHGVLNVPLSKRGNIHADIAKAKKIYAEEWKLMQRAANLRRAKAVTP